MTPKTLPHPAEVQPVGLQADTPKSYLTLSAVGELAPEGCGSVAVIEDLLEGIELADEPHEAWLLTDRLIDYVWGPDRRGQHIVRRPDGSLVDEAAVRSWLAQMDATESELRAMWGDR